MKQPTLFDHDSQRSRDRADPFTPLVVAVNAATLTKAQKQFNQWIAKIAAQREDLARWQAFVPVYQRRYSAEFEPLNARLRKCRIAMVALLDRAMDDKALGKQQKAKVQDMLLGQLSDLLSQGQDAELVRLYDKHSEVGFEEAQQEDVEFLRAMASDVLGVDVEPDSGPATTEELARMIAEKMRSAQAEQAQPPKKARKKNAKAAAQHALREQAEQGASRAIREVYRKLASELHPDRETDPEERRRKTALMQQVNQAYGKKDLLALLELQLSIEQIDAAALAGMARERLLHYNRVLQEQSERLRQELSQVMMPFVMMMTGRISRQFTPELVQRGLDADIASLKRTLRALQSDLVAYADIKRLKSDLKHYRIDASYEDEESMLEDLMFEALRAGGR